MSPVEKQIKKLRETIRHHEYQYYVTATPEISDYQFDQLLKELEDLEASHPHLITPDSPTQRVGGEPLKKFKPFSHKIPMLSIGNTYSLADLKDFAQRVARLLPGEKLTFRAEAKMDGVAVTLIYKKGKFLRGATRGDGKMGDDITVNLKTLHSVPLQLSGKAPPLVEIRGEAFMTKKNFQRLNAFREEEGLPPFANPRNSTAGALKLLDPRIVAERNLSFAAYGVGQMEGIKIPSYSALEKLFKSWKMPTNPVSKAFSSVEEVYQFCKTWESKKHTLPLEIDGIVIKIDSMDQQERLGATAKSPRGVIAYKFKPDQRETQLLDMVVQVGKTGVLTPVALLKPVELSGSTVKKASLHNFPEIERKDIRLKDWVMVEKAAEIIPYVIASLPEQRRGQEKKIQPPKTCPSCAQPVIRDPEGVYLRCLEPACPAKVKAQLEYFASRKAMDIRGLGSKLISMLVDEGLVKNFGDLYELKETELAKLDRMGPKSALNLIKSLEESKDRPLDRLISGLGIGHVGTSIARLLAEYFGSLSALQEAGQRGFEDHQFTLQDLETDHLQAKKLSEILIDQFQKQGVKLSSRQKLKTLVEGEKWTIKGGSKKYIIKKEGNQFEVYSEIEIPGVGPEMAQSISHYFSNPHHLEVIEVLTQNGLNTVFQKKKSQEIPFFQTKTFVITGSFENLKRGEIKEAILQRGGVVSSSVSKKTSCVVVGKKPGSKLEKAKSLGVALLNEKEFLDLLDSPPTQAKKKPSPSKKQLSLFD